MNPNIPTPDELQSLRDEIAATQEKLYALRARLNRMEQARDSGYKCWVSTKHRECEW